MIGATGSERGSGDWTAALRDGPCQVRAVPTLPTGGASPGSDTPLECPTGFQRAGTAAFRDKCGDAFRPSIDRNDIIAHIKINLV